MDLKCSRKGAFFFMKRDAFSQCHPLTNFVFFLGAIGCAVVIQHPAYLAASVLAGGSYYLLLHGGRGWRMLLGLVPVFVFVTAINPLFNTDGRTVLFWLFGKPYTLEALAYGAAMAGMLVVMLLWFGCYSVVLTSDKFVCLFGSLIPSLSMLLVMVLRMIPNLMRKARQLSGARMSIGKGIGDNAASREKLQSGMGILSGLADWALEGGIITADSMRARGYGTAKRTSFQIYRMTARDGLLLALMAALMAAALLLGDTHVAFTPEFDMAPLDWGFGAYGAYLAIPIALHIKEAAQWHILRSRI